MARLVLLLLLAVLAAPAQAEASATVSATSAELDGDFALGGTIAYFLDAPVDAGASLRFAIEATQMNAEVDVATASLNAADVVATQGYESTETLQRSGVQITSLSEQEGSQLAILPRSPLQIEAQVQCLGIALGRVDQTVEPRASSTRPAMPLPADEHLALRGCAQQVTLRGDVLLVAWGWTMRSRDAAGTVDEMVTGSETPAGPGQVGVRAETRRQAYLELDDAIIQLTLPDSLRWTLASDRLEAAGAGELTLRGANGALNQAGRAVEDGDETSIPLEHGRIELAPQDGRIAATVREEPAVLSAAGSAQAAAFSLAALLTPLGLAAVAAILFFCLRPRRRAAAAATPLEQAKAEFLALFEATPERPRTAK